MENAIAIAKVISPAYLIIGLSILMYPKSWQKIMNNWQKDHYSLIPLMILYPALGAIIINMYNVWEWNIWLLVTLAGWTLLIKGSMYFLLPGSTLKALMKTSTSKSMLFLAGLTATAIGAALGYYSYLV